MENENRLDDKDLSILGYKQRISELVTEYEEKVLELRVALTRAQEQINEMGKAFMEYQQEAEVQSSADHIEGEVVSESVQEG